MSAASPTHCRRLLEGVEGNFLTQVSSEPTGGGTPLELLLMNLQVLVGTWWSEAVLDVATMK